MSALSRYATAKDNVLKAVAEAQLFITLLVTIVLRTEIQNSDVLTRNGYGAILVASFFSAPSVMLYFVARHACRCLRTFGSAGAEPADPRGGVAAVDPRVAAPQPESEPEPQPEPEPARPEEQESLMGQGVACVKV